MDVTAAAGTDASAAEVTAKPDSSRRLFIGTSGWAYPTWKPDFYPAGTSPKKLLQSYAAQLNSVEVNYTFRKLPSAEMLAGWLAAVPPGFRFSFKAPQRITHFSRLRDCDALVAEFVAALEPARVAGRLGALLFQLPPNFKVDPERLSLFLSAPALWGPSRPRIAFEFRHEGWFNEEIYAILRAHDAALCIAESEDLRTPDVQCAQTHAYLRLRASGGYDSSQISSFAEAVSSIAETRDTFVYFKHEDEPTGALNAAALLKACRAEEGKR